MIYLKFEPPTGGRSPEFIGPFATPKEAVAHRNTYGPAGARVVSTSIPNDDAASPEWHRDYVQSRMI